MASLRLSRRQILDTLRYFDQYDYPLTREELILWSGVRPAKLDNQDYYFLPGKQHLVTLRKRREKISLKKWQIARRVGEKLKHFPTIAAVFVTGALAMNNCPKNDDVDLMIVTDPDSLWITRFFVNLFLSSARRYPGQTTAPDKICPNLWLATPHLRIQTQDLYRAHEILQAKLVWEKAPVQQAFLRQNSWVKKFLPMAYKNLTSRKRIPLSLIKERAGVRFLNVIAFIVQYIYMKPKMTSEKVTLGSAFFHP